MPFSRHRRGLVALVVVLSLSACEDRTEPKTKHPSLADAAAQLRSSAVVDTTLQGHVTWNGSARMLKASDCYLLDRDYVLVGRGDNVSLRLIYPAERSGVMASVLFDYPRLVELQLDSGHSNPARYRAEPPDPANTDIRAEPGMTFGSTRLKRISPASRSATSDFVEVSFEFHCPS